MKRAFAIAALLVAEGFLASPASAEARSTGPASREAAPSSMVGKTGYRWSPSQPVARSARPVTVFVNDCKPGGCAINPGLDNNLAGTSSLTSAPSLIQPFAHSQEVWDRVVSCIADSYAPFNVTITTSRPTSPGYHEAIVAGASEQLTMPAGILGVAPFNCGFIDNATSFTFANLHPSSNSSVENSDRVVNDLCWTAVQEIAHGFGLDHKFDARDPMTYRVDGPARKHFVNESGPCGRDEEESCACGGANMNSFTRLASLFGQNALKAPKVAISWPRDGASVTPGFEINADAASDIGILRADFRLNGKVLGSVRKAPFVFNAPDTIARGLQTVSVVVTDYYGEQTEHTVDVVFGSTCSADIDCSSEGSFACVSGRCVAGPGVQGGLGESCTENNRCASGQCGSDSTGAGHCIESCKIASETACPAEFECIAPAPVEAEKGASPALGVCWPAQAADGGSGGCNSAGSQSGLGVLALGLLMAGRRQTRARD